MYAHFCLGERGELKNQIVAPGSDTLAPQELVSIRKNLTRKKEKYIVCTVLSGSMVSLQEQVSMGKYLTQFCLGQISGATPW